MVRRGLVTGVVCAIVGVIALITGGVLIPVLHNLTVQKIDTSIPIKEDSTTFDAWKNPSNAAPIYFEAFVFDLVNSLEVVKNGAKPVLEQKGPYTYREERDKVNITFHDNGTVSYKELHYYIFDREKSVGEESDNFTTVDLPMLTFATLLRYEFDGLLIALQVLYDTFGEKLFQTVSVGDILWGYDDKLLKGVKDLLEDFNITLPLDDKFGLFYKQNTTDDGWYNIFTGSKDINKFAEIDLWNEMNSLNYWTSDQANQINGTVGTMFPPFVDRGDTLYIFSSDIGRSVYGLYTEDTSIYDIKLLRFVPPSAVFENYTINPANAGFCVPVGTCLDSGVLNISTFRQGAPVIMSQPHFLDGAKKYIKGVVGMNPVAENHQTFFDVEPTTGVVMHVAKRLQVNAHIQYIKHISELEKFAEPLIFPVLWVNESASITKKTADEFKSQVEQPLHLSQALVYALIITGSFILLLVIVWLARSLCRKNKNAERDLTYIGDSKNTGNSNHNEDTSHMYDSPNDGDKTTLVTT